MDKHAIANTIGVLVIPIILFIYFGGQLSNQIAANTTAISETQLETSESLKEITMAIQELRESEANKEIAVIKVQLDNLKEQMLKAESHDHNGKYSIRDHEHSAVTQ